MRLRWRGSLGGGLCLLILLLLLQWQPQMPSRCSTRKLPGRLHTDPRSWPPPQPVHVSWEFPKPGSRNVTRLFEKYPITSSMLRQARVPGVQWDVAPFRRLVGRLQEGQRVRVVVLGGSEAAGTGCD